jgi:hypothetical protein
MGSAQVRHEMVDIETSPTAAPQLSLSRPQKHVEQQKLPTMAPRRTPRQLAIHN